MHYVYSSAIPDRRGREMVVDMARIAQLERELEEARKELWKDDAERYRGDADNYTEDTATMNPDGTYNPSVSGAAPINLSDMLKQAIGPEEGGYVAELGQAPMAVMSGGAIITGNTVE